MQKIDNMDDLFEVSFTPLSATGKPLSRCGKCLRFMKYIAAKPSRLHCPHCDETYALPQNGKIMLYKELKCPLDNFELVLFSTGARGHSYPLCPYCYSHPPFDGMHKNSGCNQCTHPTCKHALTQYGISACVECDTGVLVLDPNSAPKWKMSCNVCNVVVTLFENAHSIKPSEDVCDCGTTLLIVDFNKKDTPLENGETMLTGCLFCDATLSKFVSLKHAVGRHPMHRRGGGAGGRGRGGRGGRGRGGSKRPKGKMAALDNYFL